ncbi:MAG: hypothetical protein IPJ20_02810 [Flammeovirgaceae bacterium]|nr:hypothetical protein [Flammeovirgaceae bacterium]
MKELQNRRGVYRWNRKYKIDRIQSLTYTGDDDNRTKNLIVLSDVTYEDKMWDYQLTVTDAESENQPDGGKALANILE